MLSAFEDFEKRYINSESYYYYCYDAARIKCDQRGHAQSLDKPQLKSHIQVVMWPRFSLLEKPLQCIVMCPSSGQGKKGARLSRS